MHYTVYSEAKLNTKGATLTYDTVAINVKQICHASYNVCYLYTAIFNLFP